MAEVLEGRITGIALVAAKSQDLFWQEDNKMGFIPLADAATWKGHICLDACFYTAWGNRSLFLQNMIYRTKIKYTAK